MTDFFEYVAALDAGLLDRQFNTPDMHRKTDHQTSIDASERIAKSCKTELQREIWRILRNAGPMTDGELERMDCFSHYAPSTVRKRRSELYQDGRLAETGEVRSRMKVWRAVA